MRYILAISGIILSYFMLRHRETVGELIGGRFGMAVGIAIFLFVWSLMALLHVDDVLFKPLLWLFGAGGSNGGDGMGLL